MEKEASDTEDLGDASVLYFIKSEYWLNYKSGLFRERNDVTLWRPVSIKNFNDFPTTVRCAIHG